MNPERPLGTSSSDDWKNQLPPSAGNNRAEELQQKPRQTTQRYQAKINGPTAAEEQAKVSAAQAEFRARMEKLKNQPTTPSASLDKWD